MLYDKEKLIEDVDILTLCEYVGIEHKLSGNSLFIRCPEHPHYEREINNCQVRDKRYFCYSCGASGDVFSLIMHSLDLNFGEAAKLIAECCGDSDYYRLNNSKKEVVHKIPFLSTEDIELLGIVNRPIMSTECVVYSKQECENSDCKLVHANAHTCNTDGEDVYAAQKCVMSNPLRELYKNNFHEYKELVVNKAKEKLKVFEEMKKQCIGLNSNDVCKTISDFIEHIKLIIITHSGTLEQPTENIFAHIVL